LISACSLEAAVSSLVPEPCHFFRKDLTCESRWEIFALFHHKYLSSTKNFKFVWNRSIWVQWLWAPWILSTGMVVSWTDYIMKIEIEKYYSFDGNENITKQGLNTSKVSRNPITITELVLNILLASSVVDTVWTTRPFFCLIQVAIASLHEIKWKLKQKNKRRHCNKKNETERPKFSHLSEIKEPKRLADKALIVIAGQAKGSAN